LTLESSVDPYNVTLLGIPALDIYLPDGVTVTPLPSALPLFATGLGALGLFGWRKKRKQVRARLS